MDSTFHLLNSANTLPLAGVVIQGLILIVVCFYATETWRLRKLERAQVEATQKPCLTLYQTERNPSEAAVSLSGAIGDRLVHKVAGKLAFQNFGAGPALNVLWEVHQGPYGTAVHGSIKRGTTPIIPAESNPCPISHLASEGILSQCTISAKYQSLSGAYYQSTINVRHGVIEKITFSEIARYQFPPADTREILSETQAAASAGTKT